MKKMHFIMFFRVFICAALFLIAAPRASAGGVSGQGEPVILDSDMVDLFDDGVAMMMLAQSPKVELLGVTTVIGNSWVEEGVASTIRQLELIGRTDIPVYQGVNTVTRKGRFENINEERGVFGVGHDTWLGAAGKPEPESWKKVYRDTYNIFGVGHDTWLGAAGKPEPESWKKVYRDTYNAEPTKSPEKESAVDFIIRTVKERPNEVTIVAIGSGANMAAALKKAPEIAPMIKRMVYMGGAFFQSGNVTPAAEFNFWIDPEAAKVMLRGAYPEQIIVPLDACEKVTVTYDEFLAMDQAISKPEVRAMWESHYMVPLYRKMPNSYENYIWDVLATAIVIDPSVIAKEVTRPVDINDVYSPSYGQSLAYSGGRPRGDVYSPSYGQSLAYSGGRPRGARDARIVTEVDRAKVMDLVMKVFKNIL